eukprot:3146555-Amphidinium_carterae.1
MSSLCVGGDEEPELVQRDHLPALLGQVYRQPYPIASKDAKCADREEMGLHCAEVHSCLIDNSGIATSEEPQARAHDAPQALELNNEAPSPTRSPTWITEAASGRIHHEQSNEFRTPTSQSTRSLSDTGVSSAPVQPEPSEYTIEIVKDGSNHGIGVEIQALDNKLIILRLTDGPIRGWNASHDPSQTVAVGDRIVAVNGVGSDATALFLAIRTATTLQLRIRRPIYFRIHVDKSGKDLGAALLVNTDPLGMLAITQTKSCRAETGYCG